VIYQSVLTSILDFVHSSEVVTMQQTDSTVYKLKPRLFYKFMSSSTELKHSTYFWANPADFHLLVWTAPDKVLAGILLILSHTIYWLLILPTTALMKLYMILSQREYSTLNNTWRTTAIHLYGQITREYYSTKLLLEIN